jgi:hypothetical protein
VAGHRESGRVLVRDTKNRVGVTLRFALEAWRRFVGQIRTDARRVLASRIWPKLGIEAL